MFRPLFVTLALFVLALPAAADDKPEVLALGGDTYLGGQTTTLTAPVMNDAFLAGFDVTASAPVTGDAHLAGFNLTTSADIGQNLYAAGFSVKVGGRVGGDVTAIGNTITLAPGTGIGGNLRAAGQTVIVSAPVGGTALLAGQNLTLDAPITGDAEIYAETLTFGPNARVSGRLGLHGPKPFDVPASVASADRVTFTEVEASERDEAGADIARQVVAPVWVPIAGAIGWLVFLAIVGALAIAFMPQRLARIEEASTQRPWHTLGMGLLAFAVLVGLIPTLAMTGIGVLLVPFAILFAVLAGITGWLAGTYLVTLRVLRAFARVDGNLARLGTLVLGIVLATLVGSVPFLGWLAGLALVYYGLGTIWRSRRPPAPPLTGEIAAPGPVAA